MVSHAIDMGVVIWCGCNGGGGLEAEDVYDQLVDGAMFLIGVRKIVSHGW